MTFDGGPRTRALKRAREHWEKQRSEVRGVAYLPARPPRKPGEPEPDRRRRLAKTQKRHQDQRNDAKQHSGDELARYQQVRALKRARQRWRASQSAVAARKP